MCDQTRSVQDNSVTLSGVITMGPFFRFKDGKPRCEFLMRVDNRWGTSNVFRIQCQGEDAYNALLMVQSGRAVRITGRLKNTYTSKGGVLIVATDMSVTKWNGYPTPADIRHMADRLERAIAFREHQGIAQLSRPTPAAKQPEEPEDDGDEYPDVPEEETSDADERMADEDDDS